MSKTTTLSAGIDTGKRVLDAALAVGGKTIKVTNAPEGHATLLAWLRCYKVDRVGIEASGGYERDVVACLRKAGLDVAVLQPIQVRAYATFRLQRAKNDRIDARMIAACTEALNGVRPAPDPRIAAFAEHLTRIEQINEDMARCKTRRDGFTNKELKQAVTLEVNRLRRQSRTALKALEDRLRQHADLAKRLDLLLSIPGIGPRTAIALLIRMPELGSITREQAAALAGLAPFDDDSGTRAGKRHIQGGRKRLRRSLYAAALPAAFQWNPAIIALYRRLTNAGKPHKVALVACARKLLIFANTVLTRRTPWQPSKKPV